MIKTDDLRQRIQKSWINITQIRNVHGKSTYRHILSAAIDNNFNDKLTIHDSN